MKEIPEHITHLILFSSDKLKNGAQCYYIVYVFTYRLVL